MGQSPHKSADRQRERYCLALEERDYAAGMVSTDLEAIQLVWEERRFGIDLTKNGEKIE